MEKSLRILISAFDYVPRLGGVATCSYELAAALAAQPGVEVKVIAPRRPGSEAFDRGQRFETIRISLPGRPGWAILPLAYATWRLGRKWRPDLVLDTIWSPSSFATRLASACAPGHSWKQAILVHGVEILESRRTWRKRIRLHLSFLKRFIFRQADFALPVSRFTKRLILLHCGIGKEKIHQIFNGVNTAKFFPAPSSLHRESFGISNQKVLFCLARLEEYKGVDFALRAIARIRELPIKFLVGGTGPDRERLQQLSKELGIEDKVVFLGKVPQEMLQEYFNFCDAFLLLSRIDWHAPQVEGFGLVYLEAAACAKPSIGPIGGGPADAVIHNETGLLVDPTDEKEIAAAIQKLLFSQNLAADLAAAAYARVQAQYRWERVAEKIIERMSSPCAG